VIINISVYGNTHYAWVTAAKLAEKGNHVMLCLPENDDSPVTFDASREWLLPQVLEEQQASGRLQIVSAAYGHGTIHLMADDYADEAEFRDAMAKIRQGNPDARMMLVLSALPVGTLEKLRQELAAAESSPLSLAALPLFVREGSALADFEKPQLFLLGSEDEQVIAAVNEFMRPFMRQAQEVMVVPVTTAELIRFGINAMLATRVSFMNEMAALSEKVGVDVELVRQGMAADPRVGRDYLQAGCGFGGPSFAMGLMSFARTIKEELDTPGLIESVLAINESQREILFRKMWRFFRGDLAGRTVAVWGAAFKPGTSSVSNSVVHALLQALWAQGCRTRVYDPMANDSLRRVYPAQTLLELADTAYAAAEGADAIALVTAWDEFWSPDFDVIARSMKQPVMFDGRNLYEAEQMQGLGFRYFAIGRGESI
jgi:UDPglucose 6-dehydrogenase